MKIAINTTWGGFGLSKAAYEFLNLPWDGYGYDFDDEEKRTDPDLIRCIETLGSAAASGEHAEVKVVEIPDGTDFYIHNYDGIETIHEHHKSWS